VNVDARMLLAGGQASNLAAFSQLENGKILQFVSLKSVQGYFFTWW
jgi:hypothetical protein